MAINQKLELLAQRAEAQKIFKAAELAAAELAANKSAKERKAANKLRAALYIISAQAADNLESANYQLSKLLKA